MAKSIPTTAELWGITPLQLFILPSFVQYATEVERRMYGGFTQKWLVSVLPSPKQETTCLSTELPNHFGSHLSPNAWDDRDVIFQIVDRFKYCGDLEYTRGEQANSSPKQAIGYPLPNE